MFDLLFMTLQQLLCLLLMLSLQGLICRVIVDRLIREAGVLLLLLQRQSLSLRLMARLQVGPLASISLLLG